MSLRAQVISTELENGTSVMTQDTIIYRFPKENITSKSIFIVQPTERCIVVIQGQIAADLPPGTHNIQSPANPLSAFLSKFRYSSLPYDTVVYFVSMTRHEVRVAGISQTDDLVPLEYEVAVYFRVQNPSLLVTNVQFGSQYFKDADLAGYINPIIDQEVSQVLNNVKLVDVYKKFSDISTAVTAGLKTFLSEIGIDLISVRVTKLIPQDPELRRILQLRDLGIEINDKTRGKPRLLRRGKVFNLSLKLLIKCGEAHKGGHTEDMCPRTELHIPESPRAKSRGQLLVRDRGNGLKTQPVVYRWTNGAGWVLYAPTSYEVVRMKVVNHKPMNRPKGTLAL